MLCDAPQETVKYDPPERSFEQIELGDSIYRLRLGYYNEMQGGTLAEVENNDLTRDDTSVPERRLFLLREGCTRHSGVCEGRVRQS